jgi:hypothetical protein
VSATIPFSEWLRILCRGPGGAVVALRAYFDESGISRGERLTVVSGFIADDQKWLDFDAQWHASLKDDLGSLGLSWFHMTDCENGTNEFRPWRTAPEIRRMAARAMANVIVKAKPKGFWVAVDNAEWETYGDSLFRARYPKPYYFCFEECLRQVRTWMDEFSPGNDVALIFAQQPEYQGNAAAIFDAYERAQGKSSLSSLTFAPARKCAPLQAADLAVYSTNKDMERELYGTDTQERIYRSALNALYANPASFTGGYHDGLTVMRVASELKGEPW